jgi:voltage-gated potassium channel
MYQRIKKRTHEILEQAAEGDRSSRFFDVFIMILIILNIAGVILETEESLHNRYNKLFSVFENFSVFVFTIEYLARIWSCTEDGDENKKKRFKRPVVGRIRFMLTFLALVDLMAILPFYLPMIIAVDLRLLRALRLFRLVRLFKLGRYSESITTFAEVIKEKKEELVISLSIVLILIVIASSLMYYVEYEKQPEAFSSIPKSMWWAVTALTTVGYGDVYPITPLGRFLGSVISLLGIGLFALPAGIMASGFTDIIKSKKEESLCRHCGKDPK